jgi:hypothetical protein
MIQKLLAVAGLTCVLATAAGCDRAEATTSAAKTPTTADRVARGKYIVNTAGCNDCHTPWKMGEKGPEPDLTRFLSGHPEKLRMPKVDLPPGHWMGAPYMTEFQGPWGKTYAMNLTPDVNTGIGIWTEDMFLRAIREGRHMGQSRPIMPPMPWTVYRNLTDEDLKSVYAFLRTIPAVHNRVPEYEPPCDPNEK